MNQGIKGIEIFLGGWMVALVTNYLGGLDLGQWLPLVVASMEIVAMAMILFGIHGFRKSHKNFNAAVPVAFTILIISIAKAGLLAVSMGGIADWMAISSMILVLADDILFMALTGLMLLGFAALKIDAGDEKAAHRLRNVWVLFLLCSIIYVVTQITSVLLVNESVAALTYIVPVLGLPMLIVGGVAVWRLVNN
jgi:hypothetical protein